MSTDNLTKILTTTTERLSKPESHKELFHRHRDGDRLPSGKTLKEIIELSRSILCPGYYGKPTVNIRTIGSVSKSVSGRNSKKGPAKILTGPNKFVILGDKT